MINVMRRVFPCCCKQTMLLESLRLKQQRNSTPAVPGEEVSYEDMLIYLYPNLHGNDVFIRERGTGALKRTGFELPKWILFNVNKFLRAENEHTASSLQVILKTVI